MTAEEGHVNEELQIRSADPKLVIQARQRPAEVNSKKEQVKVENERRIRREEKKRR